MLYPRTETLWVGWGGRLQQNTVRAVREALKGGFRSVEIDVQVNKDGVAVGLHDPTLDRETTARGEVRAYTWAELGGIRRKDGAPIDRLDRIVREFSGSEERVFFDVRDVEVEVVQTALHDILDCRRND